jgi:hypothetical protein
MSIRGRNGRRAVAALLGVVVLLLLSGTAGLHSHGLSDAEADTDTPNSASTPCVACSLGHLAAAPIDFGPELFGPAVLGTVQPPDADPVRSSILEPAGPSRAPPRAC